MWHWGSFVYICGKRKRHSSILTSWKMATFESKVEKRGVAIYVLSVILIQNFLIIIVNVHNQSSSIKPKNLLRSSCLHYFINELYVASLTNQIRKILKQSSWILCFTSIINCMQPQKNWICAHTNNNRNSMSTCLSINVSI